jgi:hypothetical protein
MGQCFPVPDDANLRRQMLKVARNTERIYNMYNLPWRVRAAPSLLFPCCRAPH